MHYFKSMWMWIMRVIVIWINIHLYIVVCIGTSSESENKYISYMFAEFINNRFESIIILSPYIYKIISQIQP